MFLRGTALFVCVAAALSAGCGHSSMSAEDLKIEVGNVRTLAAASALLCDQYQRGDTTATFFRTQAELIGGKARDSLKRLENSRSEDEQTRTHAADLASRLVAALDPGDASAAAKGRLDAIAAEAKAMEERLKSKS